MDPQLSAALIGLGITVIGAIGTLVTVLLDRVKRDLAANTRITQETNDGLRDAVERLAAERNRVFALRTLLRERDDRLEYIQARLPEVERVLVGYKERRQARHTEADERAVERRVLDDLDDPTGTDAGAHPHG